MHVAILSDLHLASDPRICEFSHDETHFLGLLDRIEATHDAVLVPGDVYNLDHGRLPVARGRELAATQRAFPRLTARLHGAGYHMVHGNHDAALGRLLGVPEVRRLELGGRRILLVHGHQFDGRLKRLPALSPTGSWLAGRLRRHELDPVADWLVHIGQLVNGVGWRRRGAPTAARAPHAIAARRDVAAARALLEHADVDVVVMGHTHRAVQHRFEDGGVYLNAGACAFGDLQWTSLELDTLCWTHHREGHPIRLPGHRAERRR